MIKIDLSAILDGDDPPVPGGIKTESGRRTVAAGELQQSLRPHLGSYGITRVAHLTGFDSVGLPVHMAVKPQGKTLSSGSGKGSTREASWVSAVMECCEQTVWENLDLESITASRSMLLRLGLNVADCAALPQIKGSLWSDELPIEWVAGWDIVSGCEVWVPESIVTVNLSGSKNLHPFVSGSNGLASGAHILEALLSALQEAIERDGLVLRTAIDPAPNLSGIGLLQSVAPSVADCVDRSGLLLEVVDATTEIGVPVVAAYLHEPAGGQTGSFKGMGAAPSVSTALVRAVTEAAQGRCLIVAGARDDIFETARAASTRVRSVARDAPQESLRAGVDHTTSSLQGDLEWMVSRLVDSGFNQVIVFRHTSPGDPVQVARVVVPGLEGYPFSYAATGPRAATLKAQVLQRQLVENER